MANLNKTTAGMVKKSAKLDSSLKIKINPNIEIFCLEAIQANTDILQDWINDLVDVDGWHTHSVNEWDHSDVELISFKANKIKNLINLIDNHTLTTPILKQIEVSKEILKEADAIVKEWNNYLSKVGK